jgi:hypothetical protein
VPHSSLARFRRLIRPPLEPDQFERFWHFAALTLLEGAVRPAVTGVFVDRALERFPDEPRFILSRAIVADQRWGTRDSGTTDASGKPSSAHVDTVRKQYAAAIAMPQTAVEAHIRFGSFLIRIERYEEALAHLNRAGAEPVADASLNYLRQLFLGHAL